MNAGALLTQSEQFAVPYCETASEYEMMILLHLGYELKTVSSLPPTSIPPNRE